LTNNQNQPKKELLNDTHQRLLRTAFSFFAGVL